MPVIRFTSQLNGYTALCLTKTDILDKLDEVKIGVAYVKVTYLTRFVLRWQIMLYNCKVKHNRKIQNS